MPGKRGTKEERQAKAKAKAARIKARKAEAVTAHLKSTIRRAEALNYRLQGWSYAQIGETMGITRQTAHELVQSALAELHKEPAEELRQLEAARLDSLQTGHFGKAVDGDIQATSIVLNIQARRARLFGLDAPAKQELSGVIETKDVSARDILLARLAGLLDAGSAPKPDSGAQ
jgi:hypothetical protein